jgi:hypothetical protein
MHESNHSFADRRWQSDQALKSKFCELDVQEPDDFGAGLATPKSDDVSSNTVVQLGALIFVSLIIEAQ